VRILVPLAICLALAAPAAAGTEAADPVVREVVRMLEAGVSEDVVLLWLERGNRRAGTLGADDLIALTEAQASPALMERLMAPPAPAAGPPAVTEPSGAATTRPAEATPGGIPVDVSIRYRPYRDPEGEVDEQWHLFAYLDGRPLAWSDGKNWLSTQRQTVDVVPRVSPGTHVVRLLQERHRRVGGGGRRHEARVCPDAIELDVQRPGRKLEIQITEPMGLSLSGKGTYVWSAWDAGEPRGEEHLLAGPPDDWPPLCEEIEANYTDGDKIPKRVARQLERCVRWDSLWPETAAAPTREQVRTLLESFDYRPVVDDD